jgi:hypothetical protein
VSAVRRHCRLVLRGNALACARATGPGSSRRWRPLPPAPAISPEALPLCSWRY